MPITSTRQCSEKCGQFQTNFNSLLELYPRGNSHVFAAVGAANFALGEDERAIDWLLKALDLNFEHLDIFSFLAMAYANKDNAAKSAICAEEYRRRAAVSGTEGPRYNKPRAGSPPADVTNNYDKLRLWPGAAGGQLWPSGD